MTRTDDFEENKVLYYTFFIMIIIFICIGIFIHYRNQYT